MAVTIEQMEVEVQQPAVPAAAETSPARPSHKVDLRAALSLVEERKTRLHAD